MSKFAPLILLMFLACSLCRAQEAQALGSIKIQGKTVKIDPKKKTLDRKRFYLLRGGFEANKTLMEKLRALEPDSRDCFYCRTGATAEFIDWLRAENCESPYCREITAEDVKKVPEFQTAYRKGVTQFRRPAVAQKWVITNLPDGLRDGFYRQKKTLLVGLLGGIKPIQSVITDKNNAAAIFIDVPLSPGAKKSEMFLVSNLLPIEVNGKGYVWACEIEVTAGKQASITLLAPPASKKCELIVRPVQACAGGSCDRK